MTQQSPTERARARDLGMILGMLPTGPANAITDVAGVRVGHITLVRGSGPLVRGVGPVRTGVTALLPHGDNLFAAKVPAAAAVFNGFGKTIGLVQIDELGQLETLILLTNTLNVGRVADALVAYMLEQNPTIGVTTGTSTQSSASATMAFSMISVAAMSVSRRFEQRSKVLSVVQ